MNVVAIVLAGGRSARLGGVPKAGLVFEGKTLLERTLDAVQDARRVVVVGDASLGATASRHDLAAGPSRLLVTREEPPFAGPAAATAAGLDALTASRAGAVAAGQAETRSTVAGLDARVVSRARAVAGRAESRPSILHDEAPADYVVVLACDMPDVGRAVSALLAAVAELPEALDGAMAVDDDGRPQYLTAVYRESSLAAAVAEARRAGTLDNLAARRLFGALAVQQVVVPTGSTRDVDTLADASHFGIGLGGDSNLTPTGDIR